MKVTPEFDRREEGLRALASMIADAHRKRKTFHNDEEPLVSEGVGREPQGESGFRYTETVSVGALLRTRKRASSNMLKSKRSGANHERPTIVDKR